MAIFTGTSGDEVLRGTSDADVFNLQDGGQDKAVGGKGADLFRLGDALGTSDQILGGAGVDTVVLDGDYSAGLAISARMFVSVERLKLAAGHGYDLTIANDVVHAGEQHFLAIDGSALGGGDDMVIDASAIDHGDVTIAAGGGDDLLIGGAARNYFILNGGGNDTATGGAGYDEFYVNSVFTAQDHIDGGDGPNVVFLHDTEGSVVLGSAIVDIDELKLNGAGYTDLVATDAALDPGELMQIFADRKAEFSFDGSAEADGKWDLRGSDLADHMIGGGVDDYLEGNGGGDTLQGGAGADFLSGEGGHDWYVYASVADSAGDSIDNIINLEDGDVIDLSAIDADITRAGDQKFRLVDAFTHHAGQLMLVDNGGETQLLADVDGDGSADMQIDIWGSHGDFSHFKF